MMGRHHNRLVNLRRDGIGAPLTNLWPTGYLHGSKVHVALMWSCYVGPHVEPKCLVGEIPVPSVDEIQPTPFITHIGRLQKYSNSFF